MKNKKFGTVGFYDFVKGLFMAVLNAIAGAIIKLLEPGNTFRWSAIWLFALAGLLTYITKELLTNSKGEILTKEPPER